MKRRDFLQSSAAMGVPLVAPRLALSQPTSLDNNVLVCLFQRGGADGLNMVVPHGDNDYYDLRPNLAIPAADTSDLDGFFGLNAAMAPLLPLWDAGELAIVQAVGSPSDSRSHFDAQDFMERGSIDKSANVFDGWLNRYLVQTASQDATAFRAVGLGPKLPLALRGESNALSVANLSGFKLQVPDASSRAMNRLLTGLYSDQQALDDNAEAVFSAIEQLDRAVDDVQLDPNLGYPMTSLGNQLQQLAILLRAGIGVEVACVEIDGWDHHDQEDQELPPLLGEFSQALAAFRADLGQLMDQVTVVTMTEFGRRAAENASMGTDHGHGSVMLALGGGVNGGLYSDWPGLGQAQLNRGDLEVTTDFRTVLSDLLSNRMRPADLSGIFPQFDGPSALGLSNPG